MYACSGKESLEIVACEEPAQSSIPSQTATTTGKDALSTSSASSSNPASGGAVGCRDAPQPPKPSKVKAAKPNIAATDNLAEAMAPVPEVEKGEDTPKKSCKRKVPEDELTPEKEADPSKKPFKRPDGFGGRVNKTDECSCCGLPRSSRQRSGVCERCLLKCRQDFKHQRISEVIADPELKAAFRAAALEAQEKATRSGSDSESQRLKRLEALADRFESLMDRFEASFA